MAGETVVATGDTGSNPYFNVETARFAIAAEALSCVEGNFPAGCLPEEGFTVLFSAGGERRPVTGIGENVAVGVAAGLIFGPARRPGYQGEGEAVSNSDRFVGVSKVVFELEGRESLPNAVSVGVGKQKEMGVPLSSFYLRGFASGSADVAVQDAAERAFVGGLGDVVHCVAGPSYKASELQAALQTLGDLATSSRSPAAE